MSAPVKNTCPNIDKLQKVIDRAYNTARDNRIKYKDEEPFDAFNDIEDDLYGVSDALEGLRSDNSALREWGYSLDEQLQESAQQIADLEDEIEKLKSQITTTTTP